MIGYHLTSAENWENINKSGQLRMYTTWSHKELFDNKFPPLGVWIWQERLEPYAEFTNVIWHVQTKQTKRVVVLELEYKEADLLLNEDGKSVSIDHHISLCSGMEFYERVKATILNRPFYAAELKFVKEYNLSRYLESEEDEKATRTEASREEGTKAGNKSRIRANDSRAHTFEHRELENDNSGAVGSNGALEAGSIGITSGPSNGLRPTDHQDGQAV